MRTEDDLRAAFIALEQHAPDAARVLPGARRRPRTRRSRPAWHLLTAAAAEELSSERGLESPTRNRFHRLRPAWRLAIAMPLALGLAAGVMVEVLPSGQAALTVQLLADRAAAAALASRSICTTRPRSTTSRLASGCTGTCARTARIARSGQPPTTRRKHST